MRKESCFRDVSFLKSISNRIISGLCKSKTTFIEICSLDWEKCQSNKWSVIFLHTFIHNRWKHNTSMRTIKRYEDTLRLLKVLTNMKIFTIFLLEFLRRFSILWNFPWSAVTLPCFYWSTMFGHEREVIIAYFIHGVSIKSGPKDVSVIAMLALKSITKLISRRR